MWEAIGQGICILGIAASKGSVAIFLLRIVLRKWHIAVLWFCIVSTTIMCALTTTLLFLQCKPTAFLWDRTIAGGTCWLDFTKVGLSMGGEILSNDSGRKTNVEQHGLQQWTSLSPFFRGMQSWA